MTMNEREYVPVVVDGKVVLVPVFEPEEIAALVSAEENGRCQA